MKTEQALEIIKEVLNQASKAGLFENMDSSFIASCAFNLIANKLKTVDGTLSDNS